MIKSHIGMDPPPKLQPNINITEHTFTSTTLETHLEFGSNKMLYSLYLSQPELKILAKLKNSILICKTQSEFSLIEHQIIPNIHKICHKVRPL